MAKPLDRTRFLSEPTRLRIAELCRDESLSLEEIAARLGRASGSLSQPQTMRKRRALQERRRKAADGRGPVKVFRLNPTWEEALEEAQRHRAPGGMTQDLLLIPLSETAAACAAIADGIDDIEWGARVSGERAGLVVAPQADASGASTIRVVQALAGVVQLMHVHLGDAMSPSELREWSARVIAVTDQVGELPKPS